VTIICSVERSAKTGEGKKVKRRFDHLVEKKEKKRGKELVFYLGGLQALGAG